MDFSESHTTALSLINAAGNEFMTVSLFCITISYCYSILWIKRQCLYTSPVTSVIFTIKFVLLLEMFIRSIYLHLVTKLFHKMSCHFNYGNAVFMFPCLYHLLTHYSWSCTSDVSLIVYLFFYFFSSEASNMFYCIQCFPLHIQKVLKVVRYILHHVGNFMCVINAPFIVGHTNTIRFAASKYVCTYILLFVHQQVNQVSVCLVSYEGS